MKHRGMTFWYNTALVTFAVVAMSITWTVMSTGFASSDKVKEVVEEAVLDSSNNLQVIGKITGAADVADSTIKITSTPLTATTTGLIDLRPQNVKVIYKIVKDGSYEISYDNIYSGMLEGDFSSLKSALEAAKEKGLIKINPNVDAEKPDTTTAFLYFVINQDNNVLLGNDEIANLVVIYADKDRPTTGEFIRLQVEEREGLLLDIQRTIPNISSSIVDLGGKVKSQD
jgi:flagellin FlaB